MSVVRVQALLRDLEVIRDECLGKDETVKKTRVADGFFGIKEDLTMLLEEISRVRHFLAFMSHGLTPLFSGFCSCLQFVMILCVFLFWLHTANQRAQ